jgi:pyrimidine-nucleoside phosphorylase
MDIKTIISKKRMGGPKGELTKDEIKYFVGKWMKGEVSNSQAAALMSYIYKNGLTEDEIIRFVIEVGNSGDVLDLSKISNNIVDKHSTGGVGDKITLILLPVIAALGLPVAKISSRGYGNSGGTIDKLASIPGFNSNLSINEFQENVENIGISIASQDLNLAPAEEKLYKLRNEIACNDSIVLIAISLMSLKIATGSNKIVFDLSCGKRYIS